MTKMTPLTVPVLDGGHSAKSGDRDPVGLTSVVEYLERLFGYNSAYEKFKQTGQSTVHHV